MHFVRGGGLVGNALSQIVQGVSFKFVAHRLFRCLHDRMNGTGTSCCPSWHTVVEYRATATNFTALEQGLVTVDSDNYVMHGNAIGGPCKSETAFDPLRGYNEFGLGQLGEQLGQELARNALKFGQIPNTGFRYGAIRTDQEQQAVQAVFNPCADVRHSQLRQ